MVMVRIPSYVYHSIWSNSEDDLAQFLIIKLDYFKVEATEYFVVLIKMFILVLDVN